MKPASRATASANPPSVRAESQPCSGASITVKVRARIAERREDEPDPVHGRTARVTGGGHDGQGQEERERRQRHLHPERRRPAAGFQQRAAHDRAERHRHPGGGAPQADRLRAGGPLREQVDDRGERGRKDDRRADAHQRAAGDEGVARVDEGGGAVGQPVDHEAHEEQSLAAEAVAEGTRGEDERGEDQRVGVHHPLQLPRRGSSSRRERGERDVDDRRVDRHGEGAEEEHGERTGGEAFMTAVDSWSLLKIK